MIRLFVNSHIIFQKMLLFHQNAINYACNKLRKRNLSALCW